MSPYYKSPAPSLLYMAKRAAQARHGGARHDGARRRCRADIPA